MLRHDNADKRLTPIGQEIGLVSDERWQRYCAKQESVQKGSEALENAFLNESHNDRLAELGYAPVRQKTSLFDLMKRPELDLERTLAIARACGLAPELTEDRLAREQVELNAMYDGYLRQQVRQTEQARKLEELRIPAQFSYDVLKGLSFESREKLGRIRPATVGQASRVPGVRPSDIALLIGYLRNGSREKAPA
jgi:tRNA uridine 5-carboxymethylaminomethyl modification enzyme